MLEVAGGILLALVVLSLLPFMLRSIGAVKALVPVLLIGAFFLFTEFGRTLLPIAVAIGVFGGASWRSIAIWTPSALGDVRCPIGCPPGAHPHPWAGAGALLPKGRRALPLI